MLEKHSNKRSETEGEAAHIPTEVMAFNFFGQAILVQHLDGKELYFIVNIDNGWILEPLHGEDDAVRAIGITQMLLVQEGMQAKFESEQDAITAVRQIWLDQKSKSESDEREKMSLEEVIELAPKQVLEKIGMDKSHFSQTSFQEIVEIYFRVAARVTGEKAELRDSIDELYEVVMEELSLGNHAGVRLAIPHFDLAKLDIYQGSRTVESGQREAVRFVFNPNVVTDDNETDALREAFQKEIFLYLLSSGNGIAILR